MARLPERVWVVWKRLTIFDWIYVTPIFGQMSGCLRIWALIGAEWAEIGVWDAPASSNCACDGPQARIASISGRMPMMFMTRVRL